MIGTKFYYKEINMTSKHFESVVW